MTKNSRGVIDAHLVADLVLTTFIDGELNVLLIVRGHNPFKGYDGIPGGYLDHGETFEQAARRELIEETGVQAPPQLREVGRYDAPDRDPRGRVISVVFAAHLDHVPVPRAGDDASAARWVPVDELPQRKLAFDHAQILRDALAGVR